MSTETTTRNDRLEELVREVDPVGDALDLGLGTAETGDGYARTTDRQYLLVEKNVGRAADVQSHFFTPVDSLEEAAQANLGNEYAEDWEALFCVDLDTGWRYEAEPRIVWRSQNGSRLPDLHYCAGMKRPPLYAAGEPIRFRWRRRETTGRVSTVIGDLGCTLIVRWDSGDSCAIGAWDVIERLETA